MLAASLYVALNTSGVQNYLKQSVIDYINIDSNNYLQIGNSSFNFKGEVVFNEISLSNKESCLLYTSPSPRDMRRSRMPSSA